MSRHVTDGCEELLLRQPADLFVPFLIEHGLSDPVALRLVTRWWRVHEPTERRAALELLKAGPHSGAGRQVARALSRVVRQEQRRFGSATNGAR